MQLREESVRYFIDTEFIEDGRTIDLISLGIVAEDGRELYLEFDVDRRRASSWVRDNVFPGLMMSGTTPRETAAKIVADFCSGRPEFWGYYADYDWVAFCQLFGTMMDLPDRFPRYCRDIKQLADELGNPKLPEQPEVVHNALADARWNCVAWLCLAGKGAARCS
jgi:hypothetical protein